MDYPQFVEYARWQQQIYVDRSLAILRFEPFVRRVLAAATPAATLASGPVNYAAYSTPVLVGNATTKYLFVHDIFDTIAPLIEANTLYFSIPGRHQVFIYPHQEMDLDNFATRESGRHFVASHMAAPGHDRGLQNQKEHPEN